MPLSQIVLHQIGALIVLFFSSMIIAFCPLLILRWFHKRKKRRLRNRWNHQASISKSSSSSSTSSTTFSSSSSSSSAYSSSSSSPSSPSTSYNTKMSINSMALHSTLYVPNILLGQLQSLQSGLLIATMFLIFLPQLRYSVDILMNSYYYRSSIGSTAIHRSTQLDQHPNPHPTSTPHLNFLEQISSPERFVQESHHNVNGSSTISQRLIQTIFRNNFEPIPIVEVIVCLAFFLLYFLEEFLQITFRYRQYFWACNSSIVLSSSDGSCTFTSLDYRINCTKQFLIDCSRRTFSNRSEESNSTGASNLSLIREKNNDSGQEINLAPKTMTKATKIVSTFESDIKNDVIVNNDDDDRDQNNGSNLIDSTINQNETHRTNPIHSDNLVEKSSDHFDKTDKYNEENNENNDEKVSFVGKQSIISKQILSKINNQVENNRHHQTNKYREHRTEKQQPDDKEECQIETMIGDDDDDYSHCNHDYYHDHHLNDIRNSKTFEPQSLLSNSSVNLPSYYWQSNSMPKYDQYHHYPCHHHHHHHHHHHRQQQQQQQQCLKSDQPDSIFAINLDDDNDHHHDGVEDLNGETKLKNICCHQRYATIMSEIDGTYLKSDNDHHNNHHHCSSKKLFQSKNSLEKKMLMITSNNDLDSHLEHRCFCCYCCFCQNSNFFGNNQNNLLNCKKIDFINCPETILMMDSFGPNQVTVPISSSSFFTSKSSSSSSPSSPSIFATKINQNRRDKIFLTETTKANNMASLYLGEGVMIAIQPSSILVWIVLLVVLGHKLTNGLSIAIELLNRTNGKQKCLPHSTTILFTSLPSLGCLSVIVFNCLIAWQTKMSNSISMEYSCFRMILISLSLATLLHQTILIIQQRYCFTFSLNDFYQPESKQSKKFRKKNLVENQSKSRSSTSSSIRSEMNQSGRIYLNTSSTINDENCLKRDKRTKNRIETKKSRKEKNSKTAHSDRNVSKHRQDPMYTINPTRSNFFHYFMMYFGFIIILLVIAFLNMKHYKIYK